MKSRTPTRQEIEKLVSYLPRLYSEGFKPIERWSGGKSKDGVCTMPWPEYDPLVKEFFELVEKDCWCDYEYDPAIAGKMLNDEDVVSEASLDDVKTMLTFCVRGERFCEGHWGSMIESGNIRRLLQRLIAIIADDSTRDDLADDLSSMDDMPF